MTAAIFFLSLAAGMAVAATVLVFGAPGVAAISTLSLLSGVLAATSSPDSRRG